MISPNNWSALIDVVEIRNVVVHNNGLIEARPPLPEYKFQGLPSAGDNIGPLGREVLIMLAMSPRAAFSVAELISARIVPELQTAETLASAGEGTGAFLDGIKGGEGLGMFESRTFQVSEKGLGIVERHLTQFGEVPENAAMIARLRGALSSGAGITGADGSFYFHEVSEATMMGRGMSYEAAHAASLGKYGVSPFSVYHPEVVQALPGSFNTNWGAFWGL